MGESKGSFFVRGVFQVDFEDWEGFEHKDRKEGISHTGENVSKGLELRNYREAAIFASRMHEEAVKKGELESMIGAR